jgi:hypothetical protein
MIEKINQTVPFTLIFEEGQPIEPPAVGHTAKQINVPRTSQLTFSYRLKIPPELEPANYAIAGIELEFGHGNPPLFDGTSLIPLPASPSAIRVHERALATAVQETGDANAALTAANNAVTAAKAKVTTLINQIFWLKLAVEKMPPESIEERQAHGQLNLLENEKTAAEQEVKTLEGVVTLAVTALHYYESKEQTIQAEKPDPWTPLVTATLSRNFDALRFALTLAKGIPRNPLAVKTGLNCELEYTIEVARAEDLGTQPIAEVGR